MRTWLAKKLPPLPATLLTALVYFLVAAAIFRYWGLDRGVMRYLEI